MMTKNRCVRLFELGQSPWLDYISRGLIRSGELKRMIDEGIIYGVTSNPSIFEKAITSSGEYSGAVERLYNKGKNALEIYETLAIDDITNAADILKPVYEATGGLDGYVSLETLPKFAYDTKATIDDVRRLNSAINRRNVLFKVPATQEGIVAIEQLIAEGININATLIFSLNQYKSVANAYISGFKEFGKTGSDLKDVTSVASIFVSRIDTTIDKLLDKPSLKKLLGKAAVANSKLIYKRFNEIFSSEEFKPLQKKGAKIQRIVWGSTSTKNPAYSDVKYVEELIGKDTVNTMPQETLNAFQDHGACKVTLHEGIDGAEKIIDELRRQGIDIDRICSQLLTEGVSAFSNSFDKLIASLDKAAKVRDRDDCIRCNS